MSDLSIAGSAASLPPTTEVVDAAGPTPMDSQSLPHVTIPKSSAQLQPAPIVSPTFTTRATPSHVHPSTRAAALGAPSAQHLSAVPLPRGGGASFGPAAARGVVVGLLSRGAGADGDIPGLYESQQDGGFEFQGDDAALFEDVCVAAGAVEQLGQGIANLDPILSHGVGSDTAAAPTGQSPAKPARVGSPSRRNGHGDTDSAVHVSRGGGSNLRTASVKVAHRANERGVEEAGGQQGRTPITRTHQVDCPPHPCTCMPQIEAVA